MRNSHSWIVALAMLPLLGSVSAEMQDPTENTETNILPMEEVVEIEISGTFKEWCQIEGGLEVHCYITSDLCAEILWDSQNQQYLILDDSGDIIGGGSTYKVKKTGQYLDPDTGLEAEVWRIDLTDPWF